MSTIKVFDEIKSGKLYQIDAIARGYYDFRAKVIPEVNTPLSYNMKVYDGLIYNVDLSKNSVRCGEINFNSTVLPYIEDNKLKQTDYCFGNSGTIYDLPIYDKVYTNINKIGDFDIGDGIVSNFYRDHYLTVTLPNYSSGSVNSFEICMKVHTPTNNTSNGRILNSTDSYDNLAVDLGSNPGFNFCGDSIGFGLQFTADIDLWVKVKFDGTNLSLHHSLNGVDYTQDNSKSWAKSAVWFTSNTYSIGLRSYDFADVCFFNGTIDLNECYVKINDEIINFDESSLVKKQNYTLVGNAKIENWVCSGFDSSSKVILNNINFTNEKDTVIGFATASDVTTAQKIFEYQDDGISFQIVDGKIQYWTKNDRTWHDYETVEANNSYKLKITITSNTSYTLGFMNVNDSDYNNIEVTDTSLTVGKNLTFYIGTNSDSFEKPFQGTIDVSDIPGARAVESKPGLFLDYTDTGEAVELNCHAKSNDNVVLSTNETLDGYRWLGKVSIPEHKVYSGPYSLKLGDRIDNKATVVGTFESRDLGKVVFAVLDAQYRGINVAWANYYTDVLPKYSSSADALNAKESATYNTTILSNAGIDNFPAANYVRNRKSIEYEGKSYQCQLPNAYELQQIFNNKELLDSYDTTAESNSSKKLSNWGFENKNSNGGRSDGVYSSSMCDMYGVYYLLSNGSWGNSKTSTFAVIPIIEIPLSE